MRTLLPAAVTLSVALLLPAPATAQDVTRRSYAFMERQLSIEVLAETPGVLHIVRGVPGQLAVSARTDGGFPEFALAGHGRDRLTLTAVGGSRAEYVVTVPEHVQLHLALPGRPMERAPYAGTGRFLWSTRGDAPGGPAAADPGGVSANTEIPTSGVAIPVAYSAATAPAELHFHDLFAVRRLEVRVGGGTFAVAASRPLELTPGDPRRMELRVTGEPLDIVVHVPAGTQQFTLSAGSVQALVLRSGTADSRCAPITIQRLPDEQRFTLTPVAGALNCR